MNNAFVSSPAPLHKPTHPRSLHNQSTPKAKRTMLLTNALLMLPVAVAGSPICRHDGNNTTTIYTTITEAPIFPIPFPTPRFSNTTSFIPVSTKAPRLNQTTTFFTVATPAPPLMPVDANSTMAASATGLPANGLAFMPPKA